MYRDGEKKILAALESGPKHFKDLSKKVGKKKNPNGILNPSILSNYLNSLRLKGLIETGYVETIKDKKGKKIEHISKRYRLKAISHARLLFNAITDFMEEYLDKTSNKELIKSMNIYSPTFKDENVGSSSFILVDPKHEFRETIVHTLKFDEKFGEDLERIKKKLDDLWDSYIIEKKPRAKKIIQTYRRYLNRVLEIAYLPFYWNKNEDLEKKEYEMMLIIARHELIEEFPGVRIPEKMIQIRAKEKFNHIKELGKIRPFNLEHLKLMLNGLTREDFTEEEKMELEIMEKHLENPKNKQYYESFLESKHKKPITLFINPIWGFERTIGKLATFFPNEVKTFINRDFKKYIKSRKNFIYNNKIEDFIEIMGNYEKLCNQKAKK